MLSKRTLDATEVNFRCRRSGLLNATWKPKSTLCRTERTLSCDLKTEVDFSCCAERTLECDLKTEFDFRFPHRANFGCDYSSRLCPTRGGLKMKKQKGLFGKPKRKKSEKTSSFAAEVGLRLPLLKSTCATGVGLST
jgi:hypothetical protein